MTAALERLRGAVELFRRDLALDYVRTLNGEPGEPSRAHAFLTSQEAFDALCAVQDSGEIPPGEYAGLCAHFARARLERGYRPARLAQASFAARTFPFEGSTWSAAQALREFTLARTTKKRALLAKALDPQLLELAELSHEARSRADGQLRQLTSRLALPRHPDAGPETGSAGAAESFLRTTQDLASEGISVVLRAEACDERDGLSALWALLGPRFTGLFAGEGRARRVALDWEPLGLRRALASSSRVMRSHEGPYFSAHVLAAAVPRDLRVVPPALDQGLSGELAWADAVGRAVGLAHASPALPLALRQATVASVARAVGALAVLRFAEPGFLKRVRNLARKDIEPVARAAAVFALIDARLCAAAVLARGLVGDDATQAAADLASRALTLPVPHGLGAWLVLRLSPGGPFRARSHAFGLAWSMREHFDEDWFVNPRSAEPLRGAMARAGDFSVEGFAEELGGMRLAEGLRKLSELF